MKFPESWTGGPFDGEAGAQTRRRSWPAWLAKWGLVALVITGGLVWASKSLPGCMYRAVQTPQQPSVAPFADVDTDGDLVTLASWAWYGYSQDSCPVNSKYPSIFVGSSSTDCANVKSDVTLKYLSFQTTANSRDAPAFRLCTYRNKGCTGTGTAFTGSDTVCDGPYTVGSWYITSTGTAPC